MAKSKHAPALFEVLQKNREQRRRAGIPIPRWWKGLTQGSDSDSTATVTPPPTAKQPPATDKRQATAETRPPVVETKTPPPRPAATSPATTTAPAGRLDAAPRVRQDAPRPAERRDRAGGSRPIVRYADGRVEVSLNPIGTIVAAGGILLALFCSFQLGRMRPAAPIANAGTAPLSSTNATRGDGLDSVRRGPVTPGSMDLGSAVPPPGATGPAGTTPSVPGPAPPTGGSPRGGSPGVSPFVMTKGLNYIHVERFHTGLPAVKTVEDARQHAEHAQKWLAERCGIDTAIEPITNGYELIVTRGYSYPDERPQCEQMKAAIMDYGTKYAKEGNLYLFQCEIRKQK